MAAKDVYLYRRNLFASLFGQVLAGIDSRARHVGLIIDDPKHGLIVVEVGKRSFRFGGTMAIHVTSMNTFPDDVVSDRSRRLQLDFQCKHIGTTDTEFEVLLEEAKGWLNKNPDYNGGICNCRTFADFALGSTAGTTCLQMNWLSGVLTGSGSRVDRIDRFMAAGAAASITTRHRGGLELLRHRWGTADGSIIELPRDEEIEDAAPPAPTATALVAAPGAAPGAASASGALAPAPA